MTTVATLEAGASASPWGTPIFARLATPGGWVAVLGGSIAIGLAASQSTGLATAHLLATLIAVAAIALLARRPEPILAITAYAGVSDVFWRSASAHGPYEGGKYALIVGFLAIAVRFLKQPRHLGLVSALLLVLVPGAVLGAATLGPSTVREYLVANLAGMVALGLGTLVCANIALPAQEVPGLFLLAASPAVSIAAIAARATFTSNELEFGTSSNFAAAGGFGPVQVSSVLCFGALLCVLVAVQSTARFRLRMVALATGIWLVGQALLTFSRGGIFSLALACTGIALAGLTLSRRRVRTVLFAAALLLIGLYLLSWAGAFTDGASDERLTSTDTTNRTEIARGDLELFNENPVAGVGVGVAQFERDYPVQVVPHTEYTRLLAEHGALGLVALLILAVLALRVVRSGSGWFRMAAVGLMVMSLAQMSHSATRIGCIALGFALAGLREDAE